MGQNLRNEIARRGIKKDIQYFPGTCYVHEEYNAEQIHKIRLEYPNAKVVSHPECNEEVVKNSDYVGSTSQMLNYMEKSDAKEFLMLTECGLSSRLQVEMPHKRLVGSCTLCKYMKSNTLEDILRVLRNPMERDRVILPEGVRQKALKSIEAMFYYNELKTLSVHGTINDQLNDFLSHHLNRVYFEHYYEPRHDA